MANDDGMVEMCFSPTAIWILHDKIESKHVHEGKNMTVCPLDRE